MLLARGNLLGRGRASLPLSAAAVLLPASDRVQAEHDARPAFLGLDFLARFRSTVPYVRRQLHWCALHHVALPVRLQHRNVFWCQPPRRRQTAQERHPHMHVRGTELLLGVCALCIGLALDCASGFVVESTSAIASATLSEPGTVLEKDSSVDPISLARVHRGFTT